MTGPKDNCGQVETTLFSGAVQDCVCWIEEARPSEAVFIHDDDDQEVPYVPRYRLDVVDAERAEAVARIGAQRQERRDLFMSETGVDPYLIEEAARSEYVRLNGTPAADDEDHARYTMKRTVDREFARAALAHALRKSTPCDLVWRLKALPESFVDALEFAEQPHIESFGGSSGAPDVRFRGSRRVSLIDLLAMEYRAENWGLEPGRIPLWRMIARIEVSLDGYIGLGTRGAPIGRWATAELIARREPLHEMDYL